VTVVEALVPWVSSHREVGELICTESNMLSCYEYHRHPKWIVTTPAQGKSWKELERKEFKQHMPCLVRPLIPINRAPPGLFSFLKMNFYYYFRKGIKEQAQQPLLFCTRALTALDKELAHICGAASASPQVTCENQRSRIISWNYNILQQGCLLVCCAQQV